MKRATIAVSAALLIAIGLFVAWHADAEQSERDDLQKALVAAESATPPDVTAAKCYKAILDDRSLFGPTSKEMMWMQQPPSATVQRACDDFMGETIVAMTRILHAMPRLPLP